MEWLKRKVTTTDFSNIYHAVLSGDAVDFEASVKKYLKRCISFYDEKETFYHGLMLGILGNLEDYRIMSNREMGDCRADIILKPLDDQNPAVILELKYTKVSTKLEEGCDEALDQIENRNYADELLEDECNGIIKYGICFCKKNCRIKRGH